jgi:Fur family transcriptional regulator, ferric uptake regulator
MGDPRPILAAIDEAGFRLTEPRRAVAELIADRDAHFSAADIVADARRGRTGVGRATVFRFLELMAELGFVERLDLPNGEHAYVPCEPSHHHHVVCSECGRSTEVEDAGVRAVIGEVARRTGYRIDRHRLELFGTCPRCQSKALAASPTG